mmetsp:Transcript_51498/g.129200  ORF Transcript_51498/g.129200 Transcript_51498/m.129200 type:complete len:457 (+) Transcript_51498:68-1438(+)
MASGVASHAASLGSASSGRGDADISETAASSPQLLLTAEELDLLMRLLSESKIPLEAFAAQFSRTFAKADHFKIASGIYILLSHADLLTPTQRLVGLYLVFSLYESNGQVARMNPFFPLFLHFLRSSPAIGTTAYRERVFAWLLCSHSLTKEYLSLTPDKLLSLLASKRIPDSFSVESLEKEYKDAQLWSTGDSFLTAAVVPFIPLGDRSMINNSTTVKPVEGDVVSDSIMPNFIRPMPPGGEWHDDEVFWINHTLEQPLKWNSQLCVASIKIIELRTLLEKALKNSLSPEEQSRLLRFLESDPDLIHASGLTPDKLPNLVEQSPVIAIECLLSLMSSPRITEYFSVLVDMEMSLHSMEVVNRLTTAVELPTEFVHKYIMNCIASCDTIEDKYTQHRLVRLVCVFLQSLIRNEIINVDKVFLDLQSFCIKYLRVKEAAGLFRLLKTIEKTTPTENP